jgi:hypothetical protein
MRVRGDGDDDRFARVEQRLELGAERHAGRSVGAA